MYRWATCGHVLGVGWGWGRHIYELRNLGGLWLTPFGTRVIHVYILTPPFFYYNHQCVDASFFQILNCTWLLLLIYLSLSLRVLSLLELPNHLPSLGFYDTKVCLSYVVPYLFGFVRSRHSKSTKSFSPLIRKPIMSTWMVSICFRHMELKCKRLVEVYVLDGDPPLASYRVHEFQSSWGWVLIGLGLNFHQAWPDSVVTHFLVLRVKVKRNEWVR